MQDLAGLCSVCSKPDRVLNTCARCGADVCGVHFDRRTGLCSLCASQIGQGRGLPGKTVK
ncbi:MAG: hypothetical protein V1911_01245 [Candidatus Micrarchaeota archaeon]